MKKLSKVEGRESKAAASGTRLSTFDPRPFLEVSAALIFHKGKLLITQRHAKAHLGGLWEFPGGKREPGETFELGELFEDISHAYAEKTVRLKFFNCKLISGEPRPLDCAAFKWVNKMELAGFEFPAADARLIERLRTGFP